MKEHYFDDLKIGDRFRSEPLNVTEKEVIEFAHIKLQSEHFSKD